MLVSVSLALAAFTASYAMITNYKVMLAVVVVHGVVWSALLSASGAYMTSTIPPSRRGEGLGYWGMASVFAMGAAPAIGFWLYRHGWFALCVELTALNLLMGAIAWALPDERAIANHEGSRARALESGLSELPRRVGRAKAGRRASRTLAFAGASSPPHGRAGSEHARHDAPCNN